eukprot:376860-Rhodomonas_salina.2
MSDDDEDDRSSSGSILTTQDPTQKLTRSSPYKVPTLPQRWSMRSRLSVASVGSPARIIRTRNATRETPLSVLFWGSAEDRDLSTMFSGAVEMEALHPTSSIPFCEHTYHRGTMHTTLSVPCDP